MIDYKIKKNIDGSQSTFFKWHVVVLKKIDFVNKKVLDMGCGAGGFLNYLKNNYKSNVIGIDPNSENIKICRYHNIQVYNDYANELLNNEELVDRFDIVTSFEVLEHVYSYKDLFLPAFLFLKEGGFFCISTPNAFHIFRILSMILGDHRDILMDPTRNEEPEHIRLYSYKMIKRAFCKSNFNNIKIYGILRIFKYNIILKNRFLINYFAQHLIGIGAK